MTLQELHDKINSSKVDDLKLYFITRVLKDNIKKNSKVLDKYKFKAYQVDINKDIRQYLYDLTLQQISKIIEKNFDITDYEVLDDDSQHILTYNSKNNVSSFEDVVTNQLSNNPPKMVDIKEVINSNETLWAYCVGFVDLLDKKWVYTFKKIAPSRVMVDEKINKNVLGKILTFFNTKSQKLELMEGVSINLENKIDCIYFDLIYYIINKPGFETITGLPEEYKEGAIELVNKLKENDNIEGLDILLENIEKSTTIHKRLIKISKIGNYRDLDDKIIKKMQTVCKKNNMTLKVKDGKIQIEDNKDIDILIKLLSDYYKTGDVTGNPYGTYAGTKLGGNNA